MRSVFLAGKRCERLWRWSCRWASVGQDGESLSEIGMNKRTAVSATRRRDRQRPVAAPKWLNGGRCRPPLHCAVPRYNRPADVTLGAGHLQFGLRQLRVYLRVCPWYLSAQQVCQLSYGASDIKTQRSSNILPLASHCIARAGKIRTHQKYPSLTMDVWCRPPPPPHHDPYAQAPQLSRAIAPLSADSGSGHPRSQAVTTYSFGNLAWLSTQALPLIIWPSFVGGLLKPGHEASSGTQSRAPSLAIRPPRIPTLLCHVADSADMDGFLPLFPALLADLQPSRSILHAHSVSPCYPSVSWPSSSPELCL